MRGASALDRLLADFEGAPISVFVVWEPVILTDFAAPATSVLARVQDPRAAQYWDPGRVLSREIVRSVNSDPARYGFEDELDEGFIVWDVVSVHGPDARWESVFPVPEAVGYPVVEALDTTRAALTRLLAGPARRAACSSWPAPEAGSGRASQSQLEASPRSS